MMRRYFGLNCVIALVVGICSLGDSVYAQVYPSPNGFGPGRSSDMWTSYMTEKSLFTPHGNICDASEAFVNIGGSRGYCIEKTERASASWIDARQDCFDDGKRLPELTEYLHACVNAGTLSLSDMTDDYELVGNAPEFFSPSGGGAAYQLIGSGGCSTASWDWIASTGGAGMTRPYRCVR